MDLDSIVLKTIHIPFKVSFKHSSAERSSTQSIWIEATSGEHTGYGESCPREYVTNETIQSAVDFYLAHKSSVMKDVTGLSSLIHWAGANKKDIDKNPAAWCAIELALLDLFAKGEGKSVESLLSCPEITGQFLYTAVLGDSNIEIFTNLVDRFLATGFGDFKIKISGNPGKDAEKIRYIRAKSVNNIRIRLDANNLWGNPAQVIDYIRQLDYPFFAIEEPLRPNRYSDLLSVGETLGMKIILDESFYTIGQFEFLGNHPDIWIINLRISKMGGILRSLTIVEEARNRNIGIVIGSQVGETSLLTRAALTVANSYRDNLLAQEGAFGTFLLEDDITATPIMFGKNGILDSKDILAGNLHGFGLDIKPDSEYLQECR